MTSSALEAWRAFMDARPIPPGSVDPVIVESWERSRRAGIPHDAPKVEFVKTSPEDLARRLAVNGELIDVATPHLKWISDWIGTVPHVVYLVDADGIVLASHGNDQAMLAESGLVPGHDWSEQAMGTNGAGTALAAGRPVAVIGCEHYAQAWHGATCMGAPIHAPGGSVVGAIDVSTSVEHGNPERLALAASAAHSIAEQLAHRAERSKRVEAERALALLDAFVSSAPVGFAFLDRELRYVKINDVLARMNRMPAAAHIGRRIHEVIPALATRLDPHLASVLATGQPIADVAVAVGVREKKTERHFSVSFYPVRDERGGIIGIGATVVDLTEAREREQALARTVTRLNALVGSDLLGIAIGNRDRVVDANEAFLRIVGRTRAELESGGIAWRALTPTEYAPADDAGLRELMDRGVCSAFEKEYIRPDGTRVAVLNGAARLSTDPLEWIAFVIDITDRKRIEAEYRDALVREQIANFAAQDARREAEEANRAKDYFLATLSHELRTPLGAIVSWVRMLRDGRLDARRTASALESIERNLTVVSRVIDDLLDVSRAISGKLNLEWAPVNLATVIDGAIETARAAAAAKGVNLVSKLAGTCPPVRGDASRLHQVVSNLLSNGIKFTPAGGTVEVRLTGDGRECRIEVQDSGAGIAPEFLPHVFEPFRQDRAPAQGGLGLGLAVVRQIVQLHGGTVEAQSAGEQKGSTFVVMLRAAAT